MQIIIMTRDRYLEYGLMCMLSGYRLTTGRELFDAGKRRLPLPEDSYVILCDCNLERLTYCMFCGRRFLVIPVSSGKRLARTVLIFTERSDQLSRATDRVPGLPASPGYAQ